MSTVHLNAKYTQYNILQCPPQTIGTNTSGDRASFTSQICKASWTIATNIILKKSTQNINTINIRIIWWPRTPYSKQNKRSGSKFSHECALLKCPRQYLAVCSNVPSRWDNISYQLKSIPCKNGIVPCVNTSSVLFVNKPSHINTDITRKSYIVQNTGICEFWDYDIGVVERYVFYGIWRSVAGWAVDVDPSERRQQLNQLTKRHRSRTDSSTKICFNEISKRTTLVLRQTVLITYLQTGYETKTLSAVSIPMPNCWRKWENDFPGCL